MEEENKQLKAELENLKKQENAVILGHNYQIAEIQEIADYLGDSLGLSRQASRTEAEVIVFCGVKFMAESAKILSPDKTVLIPEKEAGCPMAGMIDRESLRKKKKEYPEATVVCYVNTTAAVKAESDICCTSSNALQVVESVDSDQILFVPDKNLGNYVKERTDKEVIVWDGYCSTHHRVTGEEVKKVREKHPETPILVHPECREEVVKLADYVGSTAGILDYAQKSESRELIIGTEKGIIHRLKRENPDKKFYLLSPHLVCPNMKKINLNKVVDSLKNKEYEINLDKDIINRAYTTLEKMLQVTS